MKHDEYVALIGDRRTIELGVSGHDRSRKEERMSRLIRHAWASWTRIDSERRLTLTLGHRSSLAQEIPLFRPRPPPPPRPFPPRNRHATCSRPFDRPALNTNDRHFLPLNDVFRRRWPLNFNSPSRFHARILPSLITCDSSLRLVRYFARLLRKFLVSISTENQNLDYLL